MLEYRSGTRAADGDTYSSRCFARLSSVCLGSADTPLGSSSASLLGGRLRLLGLFGLLSLLSSSGSSLLRLGSGGALLIIILIMLKSKQMRRYISLTLAAGLGAASFLASFTGPEGPRDKTRQLTIYQNKGIRDGNRLEGTGNSMLSSVATGGMTLKCARDIKTYPWVG